MKLAIFLLLVSALLPGLGHAQTPPRLPTTVEPRTPQLRERPTTLRGCEAAVEVERASASLYVPAGADQVPVSFADIELSGNTVYSAEELAQHYAHLRGRSTTLAEVYAVAQAIQTQYREDGYLLTRVVVPAQRIENGIFRIEVVEGFIGRTLVDGDAGDLEPSIQAYLARIVAPAGGVPRPIGRRELERSLLLIDELPGVTARAVLRPPEPGTPSRPGEAELVLRIERTRFETSMVANNRGSEFTGSSRAMFVGRANSPFDLREQFELQLLSTLDFDEQQYAQLYYRQPFGTRGLAADFIASYGPSQPGSTLEPLDMETRSARVGAALSYPVVLEQRRGLYVEGGFEASSLDVDIFDADFNHDDLRVLHAGMHYDFADCRGGMNSVAVQVRQGLHAFGASDNGDPELSRAEGRSDFTSVRLQVARTQRVGRLFGLYVAGKAQYGFDTLLSDEELLLGGEQFGRGYDSAELTGESGVGLSTELRYDRATGRRVIPAHESYLFYDGGVVWNDDTGVDGRQSLASAGAGFRARLFQHFDLAFEVAFPLTRTIAAEGDSDPRFFLQFTANR